MTTGVVQPFTHQLRTGDLRAHLIAVQHDQNRLLGLRVVWLRSLGMTLSMKTLHAAFKAHLHGNGRGYPRGSGGGSKSMLCRPPAA